MNSHFVLRVAGALFLIFTSCETVSQKEERLARRNCGSCHLFVEPNLLDKKTWEKGILPQMALRMGLENDSILGTISPMDLPIILGTIPGEPMVTNPEWESIKSYFLKNSPEHIDLGSQQAPSDSLEQFIAWPVSTFQRPFVTTVKFDSAEHKIYVGTRFSMLYQLDYKVNLIDSVRLPGPPSHIEIDGDQLLVTVMGNMDPNDQAEGELILVKNDLKEHVQIAGALQRPVYFEKADLNDDGHDDFIICAFGNYTGGLLVLEVKEDKEVVRRVLNSNPGARKVVIGDFNRDGRKDIIAMMTQGDETLMLYINEGNWNFSAKVLLRFPAIYGSNYFEMTDFNGDGHLDILYTNGDNGDYSPILKPYHGIKIFENDGENNFRESWSYPMYGASQATANDFDHDGDLDIAAISFFPDFDRQPLHNFVYFENMGNGMFPARSSTVSTTGRWLVMETGDIDADNDIDIILGAANFGGLGAQDAVHKEWIRNKKSLLVFRNRLFEQN